MIFTGAKTSRCVQRITTATPLQGVLHKIDSLKIHT